MSRPSGWHERFRAAHHEAGHAVAAIVGDWPFRYASLAPRHPGAIGHLLATRDAWRRFGSGRWEAELVVYAAGMAAEDLAMCRSASRRRDVARSGRSDLEMLRLGCRHVWHRTHNPENYVGGGQLRPLVDPAWSVADLAGHAWRQAVQLVWEQGPAVCAAAAALQESSRALTRADVRRIVDGTPMRTVEDDEEWGGGLTDLDLAFWPAGHSRLAWRPFPPSSCRTRHPQGGGPTMTPPAGNLERLVAVKRAGCRVPVRCPNAAAVALRQAGAAAEEVPRVRHPSHGGTRQLAEGLASPPAEAGQAP